LEIEYRASFLKDLKNLKGTPVYEKVYELTFMTLLEIPTSQDIPNLKALKGSVDRYRIRVGDYRIGVEISKTYIELIRVLHRKEFYRYFP
jgi:mRNA interferase RelE/StbE